MTALKPNLDQAISILIALSSDEDARRKGNPRHKPLKIFALCLSLVSCSRTSFRLGEELTGLRFTKHSPQNGEPALA
ncbi:hypothetical protein JTE90_016051 [Oedothorax gibbosus]|uniref:Transposase family protein n=1 Tax=Oedothorax gibbosus TaxID=931172 RepID=A0AAV6U585_9ARAC|nr:hypothetical protein JTE90_016051 [Oedothorax gibbosus]